MHIKFHYLRELVLSKQVDCEYVNTREQQADLLTKALILKADFIRLLKSIMSRSNYCIYWFHRFQDLIVSIRFKGVFIGISLSG